MASIKEDIMNVVRTLTDDTNADVHIYGCDGRILEEVEKEEDIGRITVGTANAMDGSDLINLISIFLGRYSLDDFTVSGKQKGLSFDFQSPQDD